MSATGFETHEASQMTRLGDVILGEGADASTVVLGALAGEKSQRSVTGGFELTV
jgi:hypothetical protein